MRGLMIGRATLASAALLAAFAVAACSPTSAPNAAGSGSGNSTAPAATAPANPAVSAAPSAAAGSVPATGTPLLPMQTAQGGEFVSPSGNISCEVDDNRNGITVAYCQTGTPPQSVKMGVDGGYTTCAGVQCLANAGIGTPTLAYGTATGVGPFVCESATTGVTCTANGKGFRISTAGITPV